VQGPRDSSLSVRLFHVLTIGFLLIALVFGGASRDEVISSDIVGLAALPVLGGAIWRLRGGVDRQWRLPMALLAAVAALPLLQLIPLPPEIWTQMPGRAPVVEGLRIAGVPPGWAPLSLSPQATWSSFLSLPPFAAVFLAALSVTDETRRRMVLCVIAVGVASVFLGAAQLAGGDDSPLRFYAITNKSAAVGFFSNRNHLASLLICVVVLASGWVTEAAIRRPVPRLTLAAGLVAVALATIGVGLTGSRAGLLLLAPAGIGCVAMAWRVGQGRGRELLLLLGGAFLAAVAIVYLSFGQAIARLQSGFSEDVRLIAASVTWPAIKAFMPFGSGMGTFVPVYKMFEGPEAVMNTYINHAHDDWLEILLEGGIPAALLALAFLVWFGRRAFELWRRGGVEQTAARAAALCVLLLLIHSAMDYPLRTPALATVFAFCCGAMLARPGRRLHQGRSLAA